jgi:flagellar protein FlbD
MLPGTTPTREASMILVTRLDNSEFYVNAEFIQVVESRPDTHITLVNGHSYVVREADSEVVARILAYRRAAYSGSSAAVDYLHVVQG